MISGLAEYYNSVEKTMEALFELNKVYKIGIIYKKVQNGQSNQKILWIHDQTIQLNNTVTRSCLHPLCPCSTSVQYSSTTR